MFFNFGKRYIKIIDTRLKYDCILNNELYSKGILDTPNSLCGKQEDVYFFLYS